jgi:hypothetical protein
LEGVAKYLEAAYMKRKVTRGWVVLTVREKSFGETLERFQEDSLQAECNLLICKIPIKKISYKSIPLLRKFMS